MIFDSLIEIENKGERFTRKTLKIIVKSIRNRSKQFQGNL